MAVLIWLREEWYQENEHYWNPCQVNILNVDVNIIIAYDHFSNYTTEFTQCTKMAGTSLIIEWKILAVLASNMEIKSS